MFKQRGAATQQQLHAFRSMLRRRVEDNITGLSYRDRDVVSLAVAGVLEWLRTDVPHNLMRHQIEQCIEAFLADVQPPPYEQRNGNGFHNNTNGVTNGTHKAPPPQTGRDYY